MTASHESQNLKMLEIIDEEDQDLDTRFKEKMKLIVEEINHSLRESDSEQLNFSV